MKRPRPAIIVLSASLAVLLAVPIAVAGTSQSEADVTDIGARPLPQPPPRFEPGPPQFTFQRVATEQREPAPQPTAIAIGRLGLQASVMPSGVTADGQADVPEDVSLVGWYRFGRSPGDGQGSVVLVGHRDGRVGGPGVFYGIGSLDLGDEIAVTDEAGDTWRYVVQSRESIDRADLPVQELFTRTGDPMLVLISCGGIYDRAAGGYRDNIVITAQPVVDGA
jgi:hypothetical protein